LTSDHGELFERGISGHSTQMLHQPLMRIPLLIFEPGRNSRLDVYENTSAIDVLPTLLKLTDHDIPDWVQGTPLPPFAPSSDSSREIFGVHSTATNDDEPIAQASIMLVIDNYKIVVYSGYKELRESGELVELFDIKADPLELENLYPAKKSIADEMVAIIKENLKDANKPFI
jgi:arylsulfatase A-like enzyme